MDQVKQEASTRVNEQKVRAAEGLGSVASAIRQASEHLRSENQTLASYADKAVDQIQLFADRMRDKEPAEMVRDAETLRAPQPGGLRRWRVRPRAGAGALPEELREASTGDHAASVHRRLGLR